MPRPRKRRLRILVVDDDQAVLDAYHLILADRYEVLDARDGDAALALIRSRPVDLVLLDLLMEGMDGITLLERLRAERSHAPVIVVSGLSNAWTAASAIRLGAVDYVTKPFDEKELLAMIAFALRGAAQAEKLRPPERTPRILLVGCPVGMVATVTAVLAGHARVDSTAAGASRLGTIPTISPDVIVVDVDGGTVDCVEMLARIRDRFRLASVILANVPPRRPLQLVGVESRGLTVLSKPVCLRDLLQEIGGHLAPSVKALPPLSDRVIRIMDYLSANVATVSLRDLGRALDTSPYYLSQLFRRETGVPLRTCVNRVRVEAARQLLREAHVTIEGAAARLGFNDGSHLSRLFLKYSGGRPGGARRTAGETSSRPHLAGR